MVKASDMLIARRADTKARADFATWQMMVKLNGADGLSDEARDFLARYQSLCAQMSDTDAAEETIQMIYAAYFEAMGGAGLPPPVKHVQKESETAPFANNVTPLKRPKVTRASSDSAAPARKKEMPVGLIFVAMVLIAVAFHFLWK